MSATDIPIRILVIEDNIVVQHYIKAALASDPANVVLPLVSDGKAGLEAAINLRPDIILLDLFLPGIDGIDIIRHVMHHAPCPIVVLSGELDRKDGNLAFEAQKAGAVCVMAKPFGMQPEHFSAFSHNICRTLRLMAQVKVTRRWLHSEHSAQPEPNTRLASQAYDLMVIGSSTGGPAALHSILESIPLDFTYSVLIAQHIERGFVQTLREWLCNTGHKVVIPITGQVLEPGVIYLAPDDRHLVLGPDNTLYTVVNPGARFTPSVDMLFDSVATHYAGPVCAMILTGMGSDGTLGMQQLYRKGAMTVAEAESSCVVFGMPAAAINAGVVRVIHPLTDICRLLRDGTLGLSDPSHQ